MEYRQYNQPGCGGCLLVFVLILLAWGGLPALGYLLASAVIGALLIGGAFWAFFAYMHKQAASYAASQTQERSRFVFLLINILVKIATADGHFTRAELNTILRFFQYNLRYNQEQMYWVKQMIKEARENKTDLELLLGEFRNTFAYEPRLLLLELVYQLIYTKQPPPEQELQLARNIAQILQISAYDQGVIAAKYMYFRQQTAESESQREEQYYATLGVETGADFATIKKAYRALSMQYHPDKVGHLGEEFRKVAEEKMKEINIAYSYFEKKFNNR